MRRRWLSFLCCVPLLSAAPPSVDAIFPAGGQQGKDIPLSLIGKADTDACQFWTSDPGLTLTKPVKEKEPWRLHVASSTPLGAHWLRFYNEEGSAVPQLFVVGDVLEREEVEPNESHLVSDDVAGFPITLNGKLSKSGDVDVFALRLEKGQRLRAEVTANQIDSPIDPLLRLTDTEGHVLTWIHDRYSTLDPALEYQAPESADYRLMIGGFVHPPAARSRFEGSDQTVYRLTLTSPQKPPSLTVEEVSELALSTEVAGVITKDGEEDAYKLVVKKDSTYTVQMKAQSLDSPLDAWLEIRDESGKVLTTNDDSAGVDPNLTWKAPADAEVVVAVRDLRQSGGPNYHYSIKVIEPQVTFEATVEAHAWSVTSGVELSIPVKLARSHGHARPVTITWQAAPPLLQCQALTIPGNANEGNLILRTQEITEPSSHLFSLRADDGLKEEAVTHPFKGATTDQGALLRNALTDFLITTKKVED
ncbi:MAG: hypothetical protein ACI957_005157 [Verrucomicrobiales bacterium]